MIFRCKCSSSFQENSLTEVNVGSNRDTHVNNGIIERRGLCVAVEGPRSERSQGCMSFILMLLFPGNTHVWSGWKGSDGDGDATARTEQQQAHTHTTAQVQISVGSPLMWTHNLTWQYTGSAIKYCKKCHFTIIVQWITITFKTELGSTVSDRPGATCLSPDSTLS